VTRKLEGGFEYYLDADTIRRYRSKPPELRLRWLYMGNLLRKSYPAETLKRHQKFRMVDGNGQ
jgi:hypothetical protein